MLEIMTVADVAIPANVSPDYTIAIVIAIIGGLATLIAAIISGFFSGVKGAASAAKSFIEKYDKKVETLTATVENLKKERIEKLEITINEHVKEDKSQRTETILESLEGTMEKVDNKLDIQGETIAAIKASQETQFKAHRDWLQNMNECVQNIMQNKRRRPVKR